MPGAELIFGVSSWHCNDPADAPWRKEIGSFNSVLDACKAAFQCQEMSVMSYLNICSSMFFGIFIVQELLTTIDDKMTRWNFISRALHWAKKNNSSRTRLSGPRILIAIFLCVLCQLLIFFSAVAIVEMSNIRGGIGQGNLGDWIYSCVVFASALMMLSLILLIFQLSHRRRYNNEESPEAIKEGEQATERIYGKDGEAEREACSFWFLSANFVKSYSGVRLPRFQELRALCEQQEGGAHLG